MCGFLLFCSLLIYGQDKHVVPQVNIGGVTSPVDYGEMVILSADYDEGQVPAGLAKISFNWTVLDNGKTKNVFTADEGRKIAFAVGMKPRHITVILDVNCEFQKKQKFRVVKDDPSKPVDKEFIVESEMVSPPPLFADIEVGGEPPPIPPGPGPEPVPTPPLPIPPVPVFPAGQFGLAQFTYDTFQGETNLTQEQKVALSNALASGLEGIASKIAAVQGYNSISQILADTKTANDNAFASIKGLDLSRMESLKSIIGKKIYDLYHNQQIANAKDIAVAWREISQGLRSVK